MSERKRIRIGRVEIIRSSSRQHSPIGDHSQHDIIMRDIGNHSSSPRCRYAAPPIHARGSGPGGSGGPGRGQGAGDKRRLHSECAACGNKSCCVRSLCVYLSVLVCISVGVALCGWCEVRGWACARAAPTTSHLHPRSHAHGHRIPHIQAEAEAADKQPDWRSSSARLS